MKPFKKDVDFDLALTLSFSLQFLFLSALLIKVDATSEDKADQRTFGVPPDFNLLSSPLFYSSAEPGLPCTTRT